MKRTLARTGALAAALAAAATLATSQSAPGTLTNPLPGGATILQFSRTMTDGQMAGGRIAYYQCGAMETQQATNRAVSGSLSPSGCDELVVWKTVNVRGVWSQWVRVTSGPNGEKYQGTHAGTLTLIDSAGATLAQLKCQGQNGMGTHRSPLAEIGEKCAAPLHFEGAFSGQIVSGTYKGASLQGTYAGDLAKDPPSAEDVEPIALTMEGAVVDPCLKK
ncbi:MAG TPA: hypothetical protein VGM37_20880 [Armatimonadota bacterium]|jgi:hypothetical protein